MKLIIDIPEETINAIKDNAMFVDSISSDVRWDVTSAIVNGTPLYGTTNGEVIQALFPNIKLIEKVYTTRKYALMDKSVKALLFLKTTDRWWNSPYRKVGE